MTQRTQSIVTWTSVAVMLGSVMWAMRTLPTKDRLSRCRHGSKRSVFGGRLFLERLYGLTQVNFWPYVLVSWIAMAPST